MSIVLNGVTLNPNLVWTDKYQSQTVLQTQLRTLDGTSVVYTRGLTGGQNITLEATTDQGWLDLTMVNALMGLAATPGAAYTLVIDGTSYEVVFRHHEAPALDLTPLIARTTPDAGDYFIGTIKLMTR